MLALIAAVLNCIPALAIYSMFAGIYGGQLPTCGFWGCWGLAAAGYVLLAAFWLPLYLWGFRLPRFIVDPDTGDLKPCE